MNYNIPANIPGINQDSYIPNVPVGGQIPYGQPTSFMASTASGQAGVAIDQQGMYSGQGQQIAQQVAQPIVQAGIPAQQVMQQQPIQPLPQPVGQQPVGQPGGQQPVQPLMHQPVAAQTAPAPAQVPQHPMYEPAQAAPAATNTIYGMPGHPTTAPAHPLAHSVAPAAAPAALPPVTPIVPITPNVAPVGQIPTPQQDIPVHPGQAISNAPIPLPGTTPALAQAAPQSNYVAIEPDMELRNTLVHAGFDPDQLKAELTANKGTLLPETQQALKGRFPVGTVDLYCKNLELEYKVKSYELDSTVKRNDAMTELAYGLCGGEEHWQTLGTWAKDPNNITTHEHTVVNQLLKTGSKEEVRQAVTSVIQRYNQALSQQNTPLIAPDANGLTPQAYQRQQTGYMTQAEFFNIMTTVQYKTDPNYAAWAEQQREIAMQAGY